MKKQILLAGGVTAFIATLVSCSGGGGGGSQTGADFTDFLNQFSVLATQKHVDMATEWGQMSQSVTTFCGNPTQSNLTAAQNQWRAAMDAYAAVQLIRFGPINQPSPNGVVSRNLRLQIWPSNNTNANTVNAAQNLITGGNSATAVSAAFISTQPTQFQGVELSEYLLFGDQTPRALSCFVTGGSNECVVNRTCDVLQANVDNTRNMANELRDEWQNTFAAQIAGAGRAGSSFVEQAAAISEIVNAMRSLMDRVQIRKLRTPVNEGFAVGNPLDLESWRSRYSLNIILTNLMTLLELYRGGQGSGLDDVLQSTGNQANDEAFQQAVTGLIQEVQSKLNNNDNLFTRLSGNAPDKTEPLSLLTQVTALQTLFTTRIVTSLPVSVSFNEDDGD